MSAPGTALVMCVYKRPHLLTRTLRDLEGQIYKPDRIVVVNNNPNIKDQVDRIVQGRAEVVHNPENTGGWARFTQAKLLMREGLERVIFIDDDMTLDPAFLQTLHAEFRSDALIGPFAFNFKIPYQDYWTKQQVLPGSDAHYIGTCGMILPLHVFANCGIDECPTHFRKVEDLWLSAYCRERLGMRLIRSYARLAAPDGNDEHALWPTLRETKSQMLKWLRATYGFPGRPQSEMQTVFKNIYLTQRWRNGSGGGSDPDVTTGYRRFLQDFMTAQGVKTVVDLGCGDWQFSKLIDWSTISYTGIDVVSTVIAENARRWGAPNVRFVQQDVRNRDLPVADLCLVKDVLQHWRNHEIVRWLPTLKNYRYALITNNTNGSPLNRDVDTGGCRPLDLRFPPFELPAKLIYQFDAGIGGHKTTLLHCRAAEPDVHPVEIGESRSLDHAVVLTVYDEPLRQICRAITSIHDHEPTSPVIVIADGLDRPDVNAASRKMRFRFVQGERLKVLAQGAAWWHRFLLTALRANTPYILKFDPDALFWRPFKGHPSGDHYGTVQGEFGIQGGCQGLSRPFAERLLASGMTTDPKMRDPYTWTDNQSARRYAKEDYLSTDRTMAFMAKRLGVPAVEWNEIGSNWLNAPANHELRYAVTHPHKMTVANQDAAIFALRKSIEDATPPATKGTSQGSRTRPYHQRIATIGRATGLRKNPKTDR